MGGRHVGRGTPSAHSRKVAPARLAAYSALRRVPLHRRLRRVGTLVALVPGEHGQPDGERGDHDGGQHGATRPAAPPRGGHAAVDLGEAVAGGHVVDVVRVLLQHVAECVVWVL